METKTQYIPYKVKDISLAEWLSLIHIQMCIRDRYYIFGTISDKLRMAEHESENPLTEEIDNNAPIL